MTDCRDEVRARRLGRFLAYAVCVVTGAIGCGDAGERNAQPSEHAFTPRVDLHAFQERFLVVDSLVLEEPRNVVTLYPIMVTDPLGGFLIAEFQENQVRVYSRTGELRTTFGDGTDKPDSLRGPTDAGRLPNGDIVVSTLASGLLVVIPAKQQNASRFIGTPIRPLDGVQVLDDHQVLLRGSDAPYPKTLLHIWDLSRGEIQKNFFPPPKQLDSNVVRFLGRIYPATRGDRIAAVHSLSDTLFFYDRAGTALYSVHIPVSPFIVPKGPLPNITSLEKRKAWVDQWTLLSDVFWLDDDDLIVQWVMGVGTSPHKAVYGLVQMDTTGRLIWSLGRTPRLLGVRDNEFFFQNPRSDAPNQLVVARQKGNALK